MLGPCKSKSVYALFYASLWLPIKPRQLLLSCTHTARQKIFKDSPSFAHVQKN